jgi:hypothetical protein
MVMVLFFLGLIVFVIGFIWVSAKRYSYDDDNIWKTLIYPFVLAGLSLFLLLYIADTKYEPTVEGQFPKEYATYLENKDKLLEYSNLNDKKMLTNAGKDKALALTDSNTELKAKLDKKLEATEDYKNYTKATDIITISSFSISYLIGLVRLVWVYEVDLRGRKKRKLSKSLQV